MLQRSSTPRMAEAQRVLQLNLCEPVQLVMSVRISLWESKGC